MLRQRRSQARRSRSRIQETQARLRLREVWNEDAMNAARLLLAASAALIPAFAGYVYDFPTLLNHYSSSQWTANGTPSGASTNMYTSSDGNGGSLIFNSTVPAPSNNYEVRTTLTLLSSGGYYI